MGLFKYQCLQVYQTLFNSHFRCTSWSSSVMFYGIQNDEFKRTCGENGVMSETGAEFLSQGFSYTGTIEPGDSRQQF